MFLMGEQKKEPNDKKTSLSITRKGIWRCRWLFFSSYRVVGMSGMKYCTSGDKASFALLILFLFTQKSLISHGLS
jgi:hypothetical protein